MARDCRQQWMLKLFEVPCRVPTLVLLLSCLGLLFHRSLASSPREEHRRDDDVRPEVPLPGEVQWASPREEYWGDDEVRPEVPPPSEVTLGARNAAEDSHLVDLEEDVPAPSLRRQRQQPDFAAPLPLPTRDAKPLVSAPVAARQLLDDTACFASRVASAAVPEVEQFSTGFQNYGICVAPWHCGVSGSTIFGGNFIQIHASGQGDAWSDNLKNTQSADGAPCDNVADWKVASRSSTPYAGGTIEYRTCKVTSPVHMWFAAFLSVNGTIDGFRFADASPNAFTSEYGWLQRGTPSDARRRFTFSSATHTAVGDDEENSTSDSRRRSFASGQARGHFMRTKFSSSTVPSINHLVIIPDHDGEWMQYPANEERLVTESAPVQMLLAITWIGKNNFQYNETVMETLMNATMVNWCFWTPCAVPAGIANSSDEPCAEGNHLRHGTSCTASCSTNYMASPSSLSCSMGVLTPATFKCIGLPCSPPVVVNALAPSCSTSSSPTAPLVSSIAHGAECVPRCKQGYEPNVSSLTCHFGNFSEGTFSCGGARCLAPTQIPKTHKTASCREGAFILHGGKCTTWCEPLWYPTVTNLTCQFGILFPLSLFECKGFPCPLPVGIKFAESPPCVEGASATDHAGKCTAKCVKGYKPTVQFIACQLGNFTPATFECKPAPCKQPANIENSARKCQNEGTVCWEATCKEGQRLEHGENCTTMCSKGYYGDPPQLTCEYGDMNPLVFRCLESGCPVASRFENAMEPPCVEGSFIESGSNCTTRCREGYYESLDVMRCLRGELSPDFFSCIGSPCAAPDRAEYTQGAACDRCTSVRRDQQQCANGPLILHGDRCIARCDDGYTPSSFSLDCRLGKLYPPRFSCTEVIHGFDHDSQLLDACRVSDVLKIDRLVSMRANLAFRSPGGATALHLCSLHGEREAIRRLLLANAAANAMDARKWTPLHVAASRGHTSTVSELLAHGGDVGARNDAGRSPGDLARGLSNAALPPLGKRLTGQEEVALLLMQAERLRSNNECGTSGDSCPVPLPGGWSVDNPDATATARDSSAVMRDENISFEHPAIFNFTNSSNSTPDDPSTAMEVPAATKGSNSSNLSNTTSAAAGASTTSSPSGSTTSTTDFNMTNATTTTTTFHNVSNYSEPKK